MATHSKKAQRKQVMRVQELNRKFSEESYSQNMDELNTALRAITLEDNFSAQIIEGIQIPATTTVRVAHSLKQTPKYRIILKDTASGSITDDQLWTDTYIYLRNNSANDTILSVMLLRG